MGFDDEFNTLLDSQTLISAMREAVKTVCGLLEISPDDLRPVDVGRFMQAGYRRADGVFHMLFYQHGKGLLSMYNVKLSGALVPLSFEAITTGDVVTVRCEGAVVYPKCDEEAIASVQEMVSIYAAHLRRH